MRVTAIMVVLVVAFAGAAFGQTGGHIGIYSDSPGYTDCNVVEQILVTTSYYVVHTNVAESQTTQFMVASNFAPGFPGPVHYNTDNLWLGDIFTGITITYIGCKPLPRLLATMSHTNLELSPPCTVLLEVVPDPVLASGEIEAIDCTRTVRFATGGRLTANGNETCQCVIGTEATSWSKVKALYQ